MSLYLREELPQLKVRIFMVILLYYSVLSGESWVMSKER